MVLFVSIIFLVIVIFFYKIEKNREYMITPMFSLGLPYGVIMFLVAVIDTFGDQQGYKMVVWVPIFSCLYLIIFGLVGWIISTVFVKKGVEIEKSLKLGNNPKIMELKHNNIYFVSMLLLITIIFTIYISNFGFSIPKLNDVKTAFASGIPAHFINFTTVIMIVNFVSALNNNSNSRKKLTYLISVIWILFLLIADTKYSLFMYVFSIIFAYSTIKYYRISVKKIAILSLIVSGLFIVVYAARFLSEGYSVQNIPYNFIFNNFYYYLTGSFYGFSKVIEYSLNGEAGFGIVFAPVINLLRLLFGKELISTVAEFIPVDITYQFSSTNVFTLFGAIHYETSFLGTILLVIIIASFIYYNFYKMKKYNKLALIPLNSYLFSTLVMSFFNCFYGTVTVWEITILLLLISYFERIRIRSVKY